MFQTLVAIGIRQRLRCDIWKARKNNEYKNIILQHRNDLSISYVYYIILCKP